MHSTFVVLGLLALISACSSGHEDSSSKRTGEKGNKAFQQWMASGAGALRPNEIRSEEKLSLSGETFVSVKFDEHSGAWSWAGFDTSFGEVIKADADLLQYAKAFISSHETELGFAPNETLLEEGGIQKPYDNTRLITLRRQFRGTEVKGAFVNLFFAVQTDGTLRLSEVVNNSYGPIKINGEPATLSEAEAKEATGVEELKVESKRGVISPILKDGRYEFAYATEYRLKDELSGEKVFLTLDNASKDIHEAYSNRAYAHSILEGETYKSSYVLKDLVIRPLEWLQIIDGDKKISTDENGKLDASSSRVKVVLHNTKNNSSIFMDSDKSKPISFDFDLDTSGKSVIKFGTGNGVGVNVYASVSETINFAAKYLKESELKLIRNGFDSYIDINKECNAFYDGNLNFFRESQRCGNTGLISDIVKHEWGHGLDDFLGVKSRQNGQDNGITDSAYSEGIGDILAAYTSLNPDQGRGFHLNDPKAPRTLKNKNKHPPANSTESQIHRLGTVIGGAFWDMHENLELIYGKEKANDVAARLFFRHLITSDRYLDAYQAVLRVDDNDGNTMTRAPHYCAITKAFAAHNVAGGETAPAECLDTDTSLAVKIHYVEGEGKLKLLLSATGASKIVACAGKLTACKTSDKGYVEFLSKEGDGVHTAKSSRKFFQATGSVDAKASNTYTFLSLDSNGATLAKRTLDFGAGSSSGQAE